MSTQLTLIAKLTAKPEHADALGANLRGLVDQTRAEAGSVDYHVHHDNSDPCVWIIYENWRSRADLNAHFERPYTQAVMSRFPEMLAREMELTFCTMISRRP
ncbi:putative quinol monooxygenase [Dongia sedimenti]|uniref:Quinol monooxygenase n=1 Tax=Dongia sedimenti TaxID=3064282 RepID=A0ABU0YVD3_9PROT|nr:putative quinol monooxygenase [Rhodospirillaceae bacterium R-7]